ncbi:helix-turn-helix transcriptional regulator [Spirosoma sp.]|uniref:AraC family transcriptional regulator n=1 Tax=Spirosoma sp. TaxID=1899569 RepID=UPI0026088BC9|nr:helix-turn-helix transcriptional regulator [Spirosoma sp.]MCX6217532.1 helix-turn-helix transcriptional regulator [Spirosoma sp.]
MFKTISISSLINQPDKDVFFWIDRFEDMEEPDNLVFPHKHNFYEILWITSGNSKQTIDYIDYEIKADTLFFISPGQLHLFEEWEDIKGYCVLFEEHYFLQLFQNKNILFELVYLDNLYANPFLTIDNNAKLKLEPIINLLRKEKSSQTIQALLFILLKQIQSLYTTNQILTASTHQVVLFKRFRSLVDENFGKNWALTQYANQLNITAHNLNSIVKSVCNKTASDIIKERILLEAKQLLQFSDDTIAEITNRLGFEDSSYFARYFKKHTSASPMEFRKQYLR